jgi:hypothetical protein
LSSLEGVWTQSIPIIEEIVHLKLIEVGVSVSINVPLELEVAIVGNYLELHTTVVEDGLTCFVLQTHTPCHSNVLSHCTSLV